MKLECPIVLKHAQSSQKSSKSYVIKTDFHMRLMLWIDKAASWTEFKNNDFLIHQKDIDSIIERKSHFIIYLNKNNNLTAIRLKKSAHPEILKENSSLIKKPFQIMKRPILFQVGLMALLYAILTPLSSFLVKFFVNQFSGTIFSSYQCDKACSNYLKQILIVNLVLVALHITLALSNYLGAFLTQTYFKQKTISAHITFYNILFLVIGISILNTKDIVQNPRVKNAISLYREGNLNAETIKELNQMHRARKIAGESQSK